MEKVDLKAIVAKHRAIDEAVHVDNSRWIRANGGRNPAGEGGWFFTKHAGGINFDKHKEGTDHTMVHGKFSEAKKKAKDWAKFQGHHTIYTCESTLPQGDEQLDEALTHTEKHWLKTMKIVHGDNVTSTLPKHNGSSPHHYAFKEHPGGKPKLVGYFNKDTQSGHVIHTDGSLHSHIITEETQLDETVKT